MMESRKHILVVQPFSAEFDESYQLIRTAAQAVDAVVIRLDDLMMVGSFTEALYERIETSDLIICDITHVNPNVMYELGYAHALSKPVILISRTSEHAPFDIRSVRTLYYSEEIADATTFRRELEALIRDAMDHPERFSSRPKTEVAVNSVFVSYSHRDAQFLNRLRIHLKPLEKQGLLDLWDDSKIGIGDQWKVVIQEALGRARVAILLISADFLASEFIVENELPPILAKAESDGTLIVPVIVKYCRFSRDKNLSRFQSINDPATPLASMSDSGQEEVYDRLSARVEQYIAKAKT
jgi:hypothetical protein